MSGQLYEIWEYFDYYYKSTKETKLTLDEAKLLCRDKYKDSGLICFEIRKITKEEKD